MGYYDATGRHRQIGEIAGLTLAQAKAIPFGPEDHGRMLRLTGGNLYRYVQGSTLTGDDLFVITPSGGGGRLVLAQGTKADLKLACTFATADAAVLATLPTGFALLVERCYWEVTTSWTGGTNSAIGLSSGQSPHNTKGDLLGGASGNVLAELTSAIGLTPGTIGTDVAAGILLKAAATVLFDRIASVFTAGAGYAHVVGHVVLSP